VREAGITPDPGNGKVGEDLKGSLVRNRPIVCEAIYKIIYLKYNF
jgi:hypothetical protein